MRRYLDRLFLAHPNSVDESYGQHFAFATRFGLALIGAGAAAIIHALIPCVFERTASTTVKRLYNIIASRGATPAPVTTLEPLAYI